MREKLLHVIEHCMRARFVRKLLLLGKVPCVKEKKEKEEKNKTKQKTTITRMPEQGRMDQ